MIQRIIFPIFFKYGILNKSSTFILLGMALVVSYGFSQATAEDDFSEVMPPIQPLFLATENRNVTTSVGQTAYLHCSASSLGEEAQVSWIRKRDLHVLTSGLVVFASDQRFQVIHPENSKNWTLQIKYSQERDSGIYECQANTVPKLFLAFNLSVVDARAFIQGAEYVKAGSTINLTCTTNQPVMQGLIYWYHNGKMLDYEGRVKIKTTGSTNSSSSRLIIDNANFSNSGNYTCSPTLSNSASLFVNVVLKGEQQAAMQTSGHETRPVPSSMLLMLLLLLHNIAHEIKSR